MSAPFAAGAGHPWSDGAWQGPPRRRGNVVAHFCRRDLRRDGGLRLGRQCRAFAAVGRQPWQGCAILLPCLRRQVSLPPLTFLAPCPSWRRELQVLPRRQGSAGCARRQQHLGTHQAGWRQRRQGTLGSHRRVGQRLDTGRGTPERNMPHVSTAVAGRCAVENIGAGQFRGDRICDVLSRATGRQRFGEQRLLVNRVGCKRDGTDACRSAAIAASSISVHPGLRELQERHPDVRTHLVRPVQRMDRPNARGCGPFLQDQDEPGRSKLASLRVR